MTDTENEPESNALISIGGWCAPLHLPTITTSRGGHSLYPPTPAVPLSRRARAQRAWRQFRDRVWAARTAWADPDRLS